MLTAAALIFQFVTVFGAGTPTAAIDLYSQCANDDGDGYTGADVGCHWTNGDLNASNSTYFEGDATVQRLAIDDLGTGDHTVTIKYGTTKGGKHAYDYLTDDTFSETWVTAADLCEPTITHLDLASCSSLAPVSSDLIPADPSAGGADIAQSARHLKIRNGTWVAGGILSGPTLVSGSYASDSDTAITIKFHVDASTCEDKYTTKVQGQDINVCEVLITWGAHVSSQADWGTGNSAVNISGSPYHVQIASVDGSTITGGGRDNQMAASAVIVPETPTVTTELHNHANEAVITLGGSVPLGTNVHDKAMVGSTPDNGQPTGNVTFRFYTSQTACTEDTTFTGGTNRGTAALAAGVAHPSTATGALDAGSYAFKAMFVSSDPGLWNNAMSACENFTVNQAQLTVATQVHDTNHINVTNTQLPLGSVVHDSASLTGSVNGFATSVVAFTFYANGTCDGTGTSVTNVGVDESNSSLVRSAVSSALATGSYSYKASVAGNGNYLGDDADCEPFTVGKDDTTLTTAIHSGSNHDTDVQGTTLPLNSSIHDKATLSNLVQDITPTGTLAYAFYHNGACSGDPFANETGLGLNSESSVYGSLGAGNYSFLTSYSGDTNYSGSTAACETITVDKANTTTTTQVHNSNHQDVTNTSVPLSSVVHDSATVATQVGSFTITGTATYYFFTNGSCTDNPVSSEAVAVGNESSVTAPLAAGSYSYQAIYSGDTNYNDSTGVCEPFNVSKADLGITTELHQDGETVVTVGSFVPLGTTMHDQAAVSGINASFAPANNVGFTFYTNGTCDGDGTAAGNVALDINGVAHPSSSQGPLAAGNYSFNASVAGDTNYNGTTSDCEHFSVSQGTLTVSTELHNEDGDTVVTLGSSVNLGTTMHDQANVGNISPDFAPTGNVSFTFYENNQCSDEGTAAGTVAVVSGMAHPSSPEGPLVAGGYSFKATVAGDSNYVGATSDCEPFSVNKADTTTVTEIHKDGGHVATTSVNLGDSVHDKALVGDAIGGITITGTVSYTFFTSGDCTTGGGTPEVVNLGNETSPSGPLAAGDYSYQAVYSGGDNYNGSTGACEPLTVNKADSSVATELHNSDESVIAAQASTTTVHDQATVTGGVGGFLPTGNVSFTFYTNGTCDGDGTGAGTLALDGTNDPSTVHPSTSQGPLSAGSYSFHAVYAGDDNYNQATSPCEPFTVTTLTINKLANGGNDTFGYTVSGPTNATPNVTTTGTPGTGSTTIVVLTGQYTVGETTLPAGWQLVGLSCGGGSTELGPTSTPFTIVVGTNATCNFENTHQNKTRTQGFWSTHTLFAHDVWTNDVPVSEKNITNWGAGCSGIIDAAAVTGQNELMGGFWANVANKTSGKRTAIDKARMQMLQQLLAAMLNRWGLGTNDGGLIDQAQAAFCGNNQNAIQQKIGQLGTFNESGDSVPLGFSVPNATPKNSRDQANLTFWDNPTTHL